MFCVIFDDVLGSSLGLQVGLVVALLVLLALGAALVTYFYKRRYVFFFFFFSFVRMRNICVHGMKHAQMEEPEFENRYQFKERLGVFCLQASFGLRHHGAERARRGSLRSIVIGGGSFKLFACDCECVEKVTNQLFWNIFL